MPNPRGEPPPKAGATQERTLEAVGSSALILIEAPSSAYHHGLLALGQTIEKRGGDLRRFYTQQHQFYGGIDLHARSLSLCILNQEGEIREHRHMQAAPDPLLQAIAPYRADLVVCVEGLFTWYWLADLCARAGRAFVLGHALYMKAIHGGTAKHETIDAPKIAVWRRGGMLPHA